MFSGKILTIKFVRVFLYTYLKYFSSGNRIIYFSKIYRKLSELKNTSLSLCFPVLKKHFHIMLKKLVL